MLSCETIAADTKKIIILPLSSSILLYAKLLEFLEQTRFSSHGWPTFRIIGGVLVNMTILDLDPKDI